MPKTCKSTIVDTGIGNIGSLFRAVRRVAPEAPSIVRLPELAAQSYDNGDVLYLPGVGHFGTYASQIKNVGAGTMLRNILNKQQVRVVGICVGHQYLFTRSAEGGGTGLDVFPAEVKKLSFAERLPVVGYRELSSGASYYFTHSFGVTFQTLTELHAYELRNNCKIDYYIENDQFVVGEIRKCNITGIQYHPEKSRSCGLERLRKFYE